MYKKKRTLAVITARGGSKSIPKKNIVNLVGKPLIAWTIAAAKKSRYLTRTIVSTDSEEIARIARRYGAEVPFMRPAEYAQDKSTSIGVVQHALKWLKENEKEEYDYLMILQPTSPFRTADDIDACIKLAINKKADSVMSMKELDDFAPKKIKKIKRGKFLFYFKDEWKEPSRRQDLEKMYKRNCAVYLTHTRHILRGDLFGKKSHAYIMPEERSLDINKPADFDLAQFLTKRKK